MNYQRFMELRAKGAPTIKLAGIQFFGEELEELMEKDERYIVTHRDIYYLEVANYVKEPKFKAKKVWHHDGELQLMRRGRYTTMNYQQVNNMLGQEIFAY